MTLLHLLLLSLLINSHHPINKPLSKVNLLLIVRAISSLPFLSPPILHKEADLFLRGRARTDDFAEVVQTGDSRVKQLVVDRLAVEECLHVEGEG